MTASSGSRVLVTGASGFIGFHCLASLRARGFDVHAVARDPVELAPAGVRWHAANLLETAQIAKLMDTVQPTHLLHLAWFVVPGRLITAAENFDWVMSSLQLLQRFADLGGGRALMCGSAYEYDWRYGYCSEELTPRGPTTVYGACKSALYEMASAMSEQRQLALAWARPFFLYGPREHPDRLVASVARKLLRDEPAPTSHGRQIRDYLHVQDVADALVAILTSDMVGPVNIGSGVPVTIGEVVQTVGRLIGREDLVQLGALAARANDAPMVVADPTRLRSELGWQPQFGLSDGLADTIAWWRQQAAQQATA